MLSVTTQACNLRGINAAAQATSYGEENKFTYILVFIEDKSIKLLYILPKHKVKKNIMRIFESKLLFTS